MSTPIVLPQNRGKHTAGVKFSPMSTPYDVYTAKTSPRQVLAQLLLRFNSGRIYTAHVHFLQRDQAVAGY